MDNDFDNVSWDNEGPRNETENQQPLPIRENHGQDIRPAIKGRGSSSASGPQAAGADSVDLAGPGHGTLVCTVSSPMKENEGTKDVYISYLVSTKTDMQSFQKQEFSVRRRFTDFVFLYKTLQKEYPASAVPPLPDKHKMEYVTGNRFGPDFTNTRAHSLHRFLQRLIQHPVLRRSAILIIFLESPDWNAHMRSRPQRGASSQDGSSSVFDKATDTFVNVFSKVHKPDRRFIEVKEKSDKLDEDLGNVEKFVARVARREGELEADYTDLSQQFMKLSTMEPDIEASVHAFAQAVDATSKGMCGLKEHTDQNYLGSLRDMEQYSGSIKSLLRHREQKQLDFEGLTEYLGKAVQERDTLASTHYPSSTGPAGFIRAKVEDFRGIDHEQARRDRLRRLEMSIERLTHEVDEAKKTSEMFDEEVVKEIEIFERIKSSEFKDTFGDLAKSHIGFFEGVVETWERYIEEMEREGPIPEL